MKKYIITTIAVLLGVLMSSSAMAATSVSFSQNSVSVVAGQTFTLNVLVNPNGVKNYTTSIDLKYPADLVEVSGFTQNSSWMSLSQPKYNLIDNTNGKIVKTAGYIKGFDSATAFGTITFTAKKAGTGVVQVENGTLSLDAYSQNTFSGTASVDLKITPAVSVVAVKKPVVSALTTGTTTALTNASTTASTSEDLNLTASVFGAGVSKYIGYIIAVVVIFIVWLTLFLIGKKKKKEIVPGNQNKIIK
jgi:hypothetical protein